MAGWLFRLTGGGPSDKPHERFRRATQRVRSSIRRSRNAARACSQHSYLQHSNLRRSARVRGATPHAAVHSRRSARTSQAWHCVTHVVLALRDEHLRHGRQAHPLLHVSLLRLSLLMLFCASLSSPATLSNHQPAPRRSAPTPLCHLPHRLTTVSIHHQPGTTFWSSSVSLVSWSPVVATSGAAGSGSSRRRTPSYVCSASCAR